MTFTIFELFFDKEDFGSSDVLLALALIPKRPLSKDNDGTFRTVRKVQSRRHLNVSPNGRVHKQPSVRGCIRSAFRAGFESRLLSRAHHGNWKRQRLALSPKDVQGFFR